MKLLVIRHAIAEDMSSSGKDKDRPLSPEGCEKFKKICKKLSHLNLKFELLLDSPLLRSQQTADIFCEYFFIKKRQRSQNLNPFAQTANLLLEIKDCHVNSIVVFGHQPFLTKFISYCLLGDERAFIALKRGGMVFLSFPLSVQAGSAQMKALLTPKYLLKNL